VCVCVCVCVRARVCDVIESLTGASKLVYIYFLSYVILTLKMCDKHFSQPSYIVFKTVLNRENNIKFIPVHGMNSEGECVCDTMCS
jgi:hypothetical protein